MKWPETEQPGRRAEPDDPIERWGRRIGRSLAAIAFAGLCAYLYVSYVH